MALLLAEAAKLSNDMVQRGVIETILEESPILTMLPFETIEGNSFKYNQETTLGAAQFYAEGVSEERTVFPPPWWPERADEAPAKATASAKLGD